MVHDRTSVKFASVAGVGFQLAAIPAAIERRWITKEQGRERTTRILTALDSCPNNRKAGFFYHFLEDGSAVPRNSDHVSTIDSALLFAGMVVAGEYFGGEVRERRTDHFLDDADYSFFVMNHPYAKEPYLKGLSRSAGRPRTSPIPPAPARSPRTRGPMPRMSSGWSASTLRGRIRSRRTALTHRSTTAAPPARFLQRFQRPRLVPLVRRALHALLRPMLHRLRAHGPGQSRCPWRAPLPTC